MSANPYSTALAERDAVQVITETPARLTKVLEAMTPEQIEQRPAPGKWNMREIVCHLADCEIAFGFRLRQAHGGERMVQPFDQDAWSRAYAAYSLAQASATYMALRAWNIAFIAGLSEADKQLPVMHPERGEMTLWTIVETMAGHDTHHLTKMEHTEIA